MYNIANFTPYPPLRKHLGSVVCLVWSKQTGYMFMTTAQRALAVADGIDIKIVGVESK